MLLNETIHAGAFIVSEGRGWYSRDQMTVALSQAILAGTICAALAVPGAVTSSAAADAGNTGNGVITLDATNPIASGAKNGTYRAVCIAVATNAGTFAVEDPDGKELGRVQVGATFNNQVKFVIADGATDWTAGDAFSIVVGRETNIDEQIVPWNPAGTDGSQNICGINVFPVTTDGVNTAQVAVLKRHAEVRASDLTWPASISATNKAVGVEALRKLGIFLR